ncbi:MAG: redoxin domain-containing protein [Gammaproteobacteria bacterium]|nr:MAG: redoxin domain-containing protein [Gammaproteobacteria bacterium]
MKLEQSFDKLTEAGLGVVAISYDSVDILRSFADRHGGFRYSMLSDQKSEIIDAFGIRNLNHTQGTFGYGIPFPGTYVVDADGIVQTKFFIQAHNQRHTADTILWKTFGTGGGQRIEAQLPQFKFSAYASQDPVQPGNHFFLVADIELPERMHLYAPGSDYTPIDLRIVANPELHEGALELPEPEILHLDVIDERVPVYLNKVRIQREITLGPRLKTTGIRIEAVLSYQTCDDEICFLPAEFPFSVDLQVTPLDHQRAPKEIRH